MDKISRQIVSGTAYTAIAKYSNIVISLIVTAILARFVPPDDFGVIAICTVFINLFGLLGDMGISTAIIQRKDLTKRDLDEYFTFSLYLGFFLSFLFWMIAPAISRLYDSEALEVVLRFLIVQVLFATLNMVPNALILKNQEFRFIAVRIILVQLSLGFLSCSAAIMGAGIYALLINPIIGAILIFILNYCHVERLRIIRVIHKTSLSKIFSYSVFQFLFTLQNFIYRNIDKLLIGKYLNMEQLGYYEKSYRLMLMPVQNISSVITPVLQPILSNYQSNQRTQEAYFIKVTKLLAAIGLPLSVFLFFSARELILIVFGPRWIEAILPFKILALSVTPQMLGGVLGSIFQTTNNVKRQLYIGLINTAWSVSLMLFGLIHFGTTVGVASMFTTALIVEMIYNWLFVYKRIYNKSFIEFIKLISAPLFIALLLAVVLFFLNMLTINCGLFLSLLEKTVISLFVVLSLLHVLKVYNIRIIVNRIINFRKK